MDRTGINWSREETILAFNLYCKTPFGKISASNKDIIELANLIGRTPGSVGLKMHNLAHHDPVLKKRNIQAMSHGSKLDEQIWNEFSSNWEELSYESQLLIAKYEKIIINKASKNASLEPENNGIEIPLGGDKERLVKTRINQEFFRNSVLSSYDFRCCITGMPIAELLIASHIKPWSVSDEKTERTNPRNGLSLNRFHDAAFDRGLITIDNDFLIRVSSTVCKFEKNETIRDWLIKYEGEKIILPQRFTPDQLFIEYHNDVIFKK